MCGSCKKFFVYIWLLISVMYATNVMSSVYLNECCPLTIICSAKLAVLWEYIQSVFTQVIQHNW